MTTNDIVAAGVEFGIQTVFLLGALWGLLKIQKLEYNFAGVLGSAALTVVLGMVIQHFVGISLAAPVAIIVLVLCLTKAVEAEHVAVGFTVAISYGLLFCMNFWLLNILMGPLRVTARPANEATTTFAEEAASVSKAASNAVPVLPVNPKGNEAPLETADYFSLKGITKSTKTPLAIIRSGSKTYTISVGESFSTTLPKGRVDVTCKSITDDAVVLDVAGEEVTLSFLSANR